MSTGLRVSVAGVGVAGPGLTDWLHTRTVLRGEAAHVGTATAPVVPQRLPPTERRRAGTIIKMSIHVADEAVARSGLDVASLRTVFSASEGDGRNCHELCEALAQPDRMVSPTRFTNSVHNASAGYWHIATQAMTSSTSLCAYDASFGEGLLEAALQVVMLGDPVLLVVADQPYPQPLHTTRPLADAMGVALVLAPHDAGRSAGSPWVQLHLDTRLTSLSDAKTDPERQATSCTHEGLEALRMSLPSARGLPLMHAIAMQPSGQAIPVMLPMQAGRGLRVMVGA